MRKEMSASRIKCTRSDLASDKCCKTGCVLSRDTWMSDLRSLARCTGSAASAGQEQASTTWRFNLNDSSVLSSSNTRPSFCAGDCDLLACKPQDPYEVKFFGEFGFEIDGVIPYAYYLHTRGMLHRTISVPGMKPFYYFSRNHIERPRQRQMRPGNFDRCTCAGIEPATCSRCRHRSGAVCTLPLVCC